MLFLVNFLPLNKKRSGKWGVIDLESLEVVVPFLFDYIYPYQNGLVTAEIGKEYYFINLKGVILGDANYIFDALLNPLNTPK